ncbi:hypothetical protein FF38_14448 [Lucilia cuprina]|uniref:Uncharacterized protein n=1 Tax=Lucilia cuprina TaxID=7375 RepID=A0A0L0C106_LUCCU|nr:hypothetical protein FF38_14448 [Lucilia cuprina]
MFLFNNEEPKASASGSFSLRECSCISPVWASVARLYRLPDCERLRERLLEFLRGNTAATSGKFSGSLFWGDKVRIVVVELSMVEGSGRAKVAVVPTSAVLVANVVVDSACLMYLGELLYLGVIEICEIELLPINLVCREYKMLVAIYFWGTLGDCR